MPCFHPIDAWQGPNRGPVSFKPIVGRYLQVPCGQCVGCRLERSRQWAVRCDFESRCWDFNSFVTLTYADECLPVGGTLVKSHFQNFMKRLRDRRGYPPMKMFMCGEYGDRTSRPHYHALLFGIHFPDRQFFRTTDRGFKLYTSAELDRLWKFGHCQIGDVSFDSAAYVARYVMKKNKGRNTAPGVRLIDPDTGEVLDDRLPEYNDMSRRSGIGREYFSKYVGDIYPRDFVLNNGVRSKPPRYFDNAFEIIDPDVLARVKAKRVELAALRESDCTPDRLAVREVCVTSKLKSLRRSVD